MANTAGFFGLQQWGTASGMPNFAENHNPPYRIAAGNATPIFFGDLVRMESAGPTGYIVQWANGDGSATNIVVGVFIGCSYQSTSQKKHVWSNYWPGSDATGDVNAFVVDDPNALFRIQANTGPVTQTSIGRVADVVVGAGNTTTGISTMSLVTPIASVTGFLPLKLVNIITAPPGANGTDITTANNYVIVGFNNQQFKTLQAV